MHPNVHSNTIYDSQGMEAPMSINRWVDKEDMVYIYNGILAIKKNEILPFAATWMHLENIMLSEISQMEKNKYCMLSLIQGI